MNCDLLVIRYLKVTYITDKTYKADGDTQELNQYQIRSLETCYTCCTQCLFILLFTSCSPFSLGIKGVALVAVLELLILSRQASKNHSWELASGLRPSCRWRQYLDASSHLDYGCRPCLFFSVGPFVFSCGLGPVLNQWTGRSAGSIFISSCQKVAARRITCCLYRVFLLCVSK